jgi:chromosome segregation ATPase
MRQKEEPSELITAAGALRDGLRRFEKVVENLLKLPLNSQSNLERAAKLLTQAAEAEEQLGGEVRSLMSAIAALRDLQQQQAEAVKARARELEQRTEVYQSLMLRFGALGREAAGLNEVMQRVARARDAGDADALLAALQEANAGMTQVAQNAQSLTEEAEREQYGDVARHADALRQQLLSARNKMNLLQKGLTWS